MSTPSRSSQSSQPQLQSASATQSSSNPPSSVPASSPPPAITLPAAAPQPTTPLNPSSSTANTPRNEISQLNTPAPVNIPNPFFAETLSKMSAVTTIVNPLSRLGTKKIMIYSINEKSSLSLEQRYFMGNIGISRGETATADILHPSTMAAILVDDIVQVYGVTKANKIALLSPVVQPLPLLEEKTKVADGVIAACSNGIDEGWLFYVSVDTSAEKRFIYEHVISSAQSSIIQLSASDILIGTNLAAFYDGENRWVVYQKLSGLIAIRNCGSDEECVVPVGKISGIARTKTQLAAAFVKGKGNNYDRVFVYFVNSENRLYRCHAQLGYNVTFSQPIEVEQNRGTIVPLAQMSVIVDEERQTNMVYAVKSSSKATVSTIFDKWDRETTIPKGCPQPGDYSALPIHGKPEYGHGHGHGHAIAPYPVQGGQYGYPISQPSQNYGYPGKDYTQGHAVRGEYLVLQPPSQQISYGFTPGHNHSHNQSQGQCQCKH